MSWHTLLSYYVYTYVDEKIRQANIGRKIDGRYEKIKETMKLKRWYNNGIVTKMFVPGFEEIGFYPGRAIKENNNVMA
jgi:hypothetical protein